MKRPARAALLVAVIFAGLQLVRFPHDNPPPDGELVAPEEVAIPLRSGCYDCHSNSTQWPWYSQVAPIGWLIARDVDEGRKRLNFSSWARYAEDPATEARKLEEIARSMANGDMAPWYYVLLHPAARLDQAQRETIRAWAARQSELRTPAS